MREGCIKLGILIVVLSVIIYFVKNREDICDFFYSKNNKIFIKIICILIFCIIVYLLIEITNLLMKSSFSRNIVKENNAMFEEIDEKIAIEQKNVKELFEKDYNNQSFQNPYIPEGFYYVEGEWQTGYVIQDEYGNEYVWVPCTNKGINGVEKLQRKNNCALPLINYLSCYNENYEKFLISALEHGGFYISRYEIGNSEGIPVSKKGVKIWSNITKKEAEDIVKNMYQTINCELINGYAYDTTLEWIKNTSDEKITGNEVDIKNNEEIITGRNKNNNIYDFCDNILEFSQEVLYDTIIIRGFFNSNSMLTNNIFSKENRYCIQFEETMLGQDVPIVIRTVLYK